MPQDHTTTKAPVRLMGIGMRTTNENGKSATDLGLLWDRFYSEHIPSQVANAVSDAVYSVYTDYESDHRGAYLAFLGVPVSADAQAPKGLEILELPGGKYQLFKAEGEMPKAVIDTWIEIWERENELARAYTADYEIYGPQSQQGDRSVVDIFVAIDR